MVPVAELLVRVPHHDQLAEAYAQCRDATERLVFATLLGIVSPGRLPGVVHRVAAMLAKGSPTATSSRGWLERIVFGRPSRTATLAPARRLLAWWQAQDQDRIGTPQADTITAWIDDLVHAGGTPAYLAARVALLVYGCPVLPLDRPLYRVFVRHGWADLPGDADESVPGYLVCAEVSHEQLRALYFGLRLIAERHCRTKAPNCERCALRELLPEAGPLEPEW